MEYFAAAGGFLNVLTFTGLTALHAAAFGNADEAAELLIDAGRALIVIFLL